MPFELFLALRYLRSRRRGRWASARVTALVSACGVACGVAALVVAMALANGFRDEMRDKILRGTAHATLARADGRAIADWPALASRVRAVEGVTDAVPTSYTGALISGPEGAAYAVLRGVEQTSARDLAELRRTLTAGRVEELFRPAPADAQAQPNDERAHGDDTSARGAGRTTEPRPADESRATDDSRGAGIMSGHFLPDDGAGQGPAVPVVVGAGLAERTGLRAPGDEGWLLSAGEPPSAGVNLPRARRVRVAGLFRSGLHEYDSAWAYAPLNAVNGVAGRAAGATAAPVLSVETADIYRAGEVAARLRASLGADYTVVDWGEANRPLFAALELERRTVAFVVALVVVVAALNITTTLVLVVVERRADIAVLGALGARARSVMAIFVCEGAIIGAAGALCGVALGLAACYLGDRYEVVRLPAEVYSLDSIPFRPRAAETLLAALAAFAVCLLATLYPARAAARTRPAEALREE